MISREERFAAPFTITDLGANEEEIEELRLLHFAFGLVSFRS
jgi:hypothetical protein